MGADGPGSGSAPAGYGDDGAGYAVTSKETRGQWMRGIRTCGRRRCRPRSRATKPVWSWPPPKKPTPTSSARAAGTATATAAAEPIANAVRESTRIMGRPPFGDVAEVGLRLHKDRAAG